VRRTYEECEFAIFRIDTPHAIEAFGGPIPGGKEWTNLDEALGAIKAAAPSPAANAEATPPAAP
jgi:hypothetical protein